VFAGVRRERNQSEKGPCICGKVGVAFFRAGLI